MFLVLTRWRGVEELRPSVCQAPMEHQAWASKGTPKLRTGEGTGTEIEGQIFFLM
jgi:hypothetical protein